MHIQKTHLHYKIGQSQLIGKWMTLRSSLTNKSAKERLKTNDSINLLQGLQIYIVESKATYKAADQQ